MLLIAQDCLKCQIVTAVCRVSAVTVSGKDCQHRLIQSIVCSMREHQTATKATSSPRRAAFDTLQRLSGSDLHADDLIDQELSRGQLVGPDRGLFAELVFGVLRHQGSLDYYLTQLVQQPLAKLELQVLLLLRLGLYQLRCLDRVPPHASVHETVELAKQILPRAKGLVNGVLRSYQRLSGSLALPDRTDKPLDWLLAAHSVPRWLAAQWLELFSLDETTMLAAASSEHPPLTLRTNSCKTTRSALLNLFSDAGLQAEPCSLSPEGIRLLTPSPIPTLPGFHEGLFAVQDEASQLVVHLLSPQPGERVLDMCAAPGGKATHLAQLMADQGEVLATDLNARRIRRIHESAERLGFTSIRTMTGDALAPGYLHGMLFDRVLLDAPCSGLGVIRRNPEAKWRLTPAELTRCATRQNQLLQVAASRLKTGGVLVYATCSTAVEEGESVVQDFLSRHPEFMVEDGMQCFPSQPALFTAAGYMRTWPHRYGCDGFFAARLRRTTQ